jgi:type IV pilus assembly protein PilQ
MVYMSRKYLLLFLSGMISLGIATTAGALDSNYPTNTISTASGTLSFYFQDVDIKTLLQVIAKHAGLNFIISDAVKGTMTLNLKNVTWEQAFNLILRSHGLAARRTGNVIFISTVEEITSNETKQLQSEQNISNITPLNSTIIHLKYSNATDVATILKGAQGTLLTARGQVAVDSHSNSIIVRDIKSNIDDITRAIRQLDIPARQVLIEARIVTVDTTYESEIGARFGISKSPFLSGTFQGANSLAQGTPYSQVANAAGSVDPTQRLNFNVPATTLTTGQTPGSIALAVTKIAGMYLDLELSALEGEGHAEIISTPRVVTSNQEKATIQTGEEIPYQEATSSGATSVSFKKAVLSLEITPQITPDNKIILKIRATQDNRGQNVSLGNGTTIPAINTQEVQSSIILNDNETVVLGGIYKLTKNHSVQRIPFLGSLPVVGALFRHTDELDDKNELLIFITPKIVKSSEVVRVASSHHDDWVRGEG